MALRRVDGKLTSGEFSYPIDENGVPNLKLAFDQDTPTSYDDILTAFDIVVPECEKILTATGLSPDDVHGQIVLLAGTGSGRDIDWILSLRPRYLLCLDYSVHISNLARKYASRDDVGFAIGDVCDLPVRSCVINLVLSQGIIQHTRSPELAFSENFRILASRGKLAIANLYSPNRHNNLVSMFRHKGTSKNTHVLIFDRVELR